MSHVDTGGVCTRRICGLRIDGGVVVNRNVEEVCQGGKVSWEGRENEEAALHLSLDPCLWDNVEPACATPSLWDAP